MTTRSTAAQANLPQILADGHAAFRSGALKQEQGAFRRLADEGQKPPVLLISCCDSRVPPETIFGAGPGELFVVRNVANLVPPYEATNPLPETPSAIEYAVLALGVRHIVVMGHAKCGGIRAYAQGESQGFAPLSDGDFVGKWKSVVKPAYDRLGPAQGDFDAQCETLCRASVAQGLDNLRTYPFVREREAKGELSLHGAYFDIGTGAVTALDAATGAFTAVA